MEARNITDLVLKLQLTPTGPDIVGRDDRRWIVPDPARMIDAFNAGGKAIQIDINHATQLKAPKGGPAPVVGWIEALKDRGGALWGRTCGPSLHARVAAIVGGARDVPHRFIPRAGGTGHSRDSSWAKAPDLQE